MAICQCVTTETLVPLCLTPCYSQLCRSIEPTLLLNPPLDSDIMTEEIFGPLLPIITVRMNVI